MKLYNDMGNRPIKEVIEEHPKIGEILKKYDRGRNIQTQNRICLDVNSWRTGILE